MPDVVFIRCTCTRVSSHVQLEYRQDKIEVFEYAIASRVTSLALAIASLRPALFFPGRICLAPK